ncbi:uncharacterized protein LOC115222760 [Octopus sinensis]|uniref:Uncharacterized protein LOC115222760 n=1 Tax=Octopus sinensis TaxID=2607531 RepID=A0A6P7TCX3_9MOLL|nr:uncharacterized protein LOC115222760 [Octopus sinensis]
MERNRKSDVLVILCITITVFHLLSVSLPYWYKYQDGSEGLWRICTEKECREYEGSSVTFRAFRSMEVLGLLAAAIVSILLILKFYTNVEILHLQAALAGLCLFTGLTIMTGIFIYGFNEITMYACYIMSSIAALTFFLAAGYCTNIEGSTPIHGSMHIEGPVQIEGPTNIAG